MPAEPSTPLIDPQSSEGKLLAEWKRQQAELEARHESWRTGQQALLAEAKVAQDDELALLAVKDPLAAKAEVEARYNVKVDALDEAGRKELIEKLKRDDPNMGKDLAKWEALIARQAALEEKQDSLDRQYWAMFKDFERFGQSIAQQRVQWDERGHPAAAAAQRAEWDARGGAVEAMENEAAMYRVRIEIEREARSRRKAEEMGDLIGLPAELVPAHLEKMRATENRFIEEKNNNAAVRRQILEEEKATAVVASGLPAGAGKELKEWQSALHGWDAKQEELAKRLERLAAVASGTKPDWDRLTADRKQWEKESDAQENARHELLRKGRSLRLMGAAEEAGEWGELLLEGIGAADRAAKTRQLSFNERMIAAVEKGDKAAMGKLFGIPPEKLDAELADWKRNMDERSAMLRGEIAAAHVKRLVSVEPAVMSVDGVRVRFRDDEKITPGQWMRIIAESNRSPRALVTKDSAGRPDYLFFGDIGDGKAFVPMHGYDLRRHRLFEMKDETPLPVRASYRSATGYVTEPDAGTMRRLRESIPREPRSAAPVTPEMQRALAQVMDNDHVPKPKPTDQHEAQVAIGIPGPVGGARRV